jgi:hypothetical protein
MAEDTKAQATKAQATKAPTAAPKPKAVIQLDDETFTCTKRESGFLWIPSEFHYTEGRRSNLKRASVYIELNRGVQFKPREFCRTFKGHGWEPGELDAEELISVLRAKAKDRTRPEIVRYEDRPRPVAQIQLEGELKDVRAELAQFEELFAQAAAANPEILELRKKVMAEA